MSDALGKRDMLFDPSIDPNNQLGQLSQFTKRRVRQPRKPPLTALAPPPTPYSDYIGTTGPEAYQQPPAPPQAPPQPPPAQAQQQQPAPAQNPLAQLQASNPLANMQRPQAPAAPPAPGEEFTVPTRLVSDAAARKQGFDPYMNPDMRVGIGAYMQPDVAPLRDRHAGLISNYGGIVGVKPGMTADDVAHQFVNHVTGNLKGLHDTLVDQWGRPVVNEASRWYEGANNIAHREAGNYGILPQQAAGTLAALSPQKDWFQNVHQAKRLMEADAIGRSTNGKFTPAMRDWVNSYIENMKKQKAPQAKIDATKAAFDAIKDKRYRDLKTDVDRARWARAWDQATDKVRAYRIISPTGGEMDYARNKGTKQNPHGDLQKHSWGSFGEIANALKAMHGDQRAISQAVGNQHKVRSFYNNIISPWSRGGHVTNDTHAIAAGLFRPLGSKSTEVAHGLGTSPEKGILGASDHAPTGLRGMYPLYHEAYNRAAAGSRLLPRQMQSITWEGIRQLLSPESKRDKTFPGEVHQIWKDAHSGRFSPEEARAKIIALATEGSPTPGRISLPEWAR